MPETYSQNVNYDKDVYVVLTYYADREYEKALAKVEYLESKPASGSFHTVEARQYAIVQFSLNEGTGVWSGAVSYPLSPPEDRGELELPAGRCFGNCKDYDIKCDAGETPECDPNGPTLICV